MRNTIILTAMLLTLVGAGGAMAMDFDRVVIVSIDAWHPASISAQRTPVIAALMQQGSYTLNGRSTEPPKTLIAHTAMMTGLSPQQNGKTDNLWSPGDPQVGVPTIFDLARARGYRTGYFYSKRKLGYLENPAIDEAVFDSLGSQEKALGFLKQGGHRFAFVHISGLDVSGPESGWLSEDYLETLFYIDLELKELVDYLQQQGSYLLILTSDHAGHGKEHGTSDPEDYRLPLVVASDRMSFPEIQGRPYRITELRALLDRYLTTETLSSPEAGDRHPQ